jgi:hypothetical protein
MENIGKYIYYADLVTEGACGSALIAWSYHHLGDKASFELVLKKLRLNERINWLVWLMGRRVDWADGFLKFGVSVNLQNYNSYSALHIAARYGRLDLVSFLLENGALVNQQDNSGWSALYWAAAAGRLAVVSFLLENGADATLKNATGNTPLDIAKIYRHPKIVLLLEEHLKK